MIMINIGIFTGYIKYMLNKVLCVDEGGLNTSEVYILIYWKSNYWYLHWLKYIYDYKRACVDMKGVWRNLKYK